jgi:hypothetical protein
MSSLFGNLTTEGTEATEDRLGGNYGAIDTDVYTGKVKMAYAGQSAGGARSVTLIVAGGDYGDREYRETIYVTNKKGENFYTKEGKKHQLPGFIVMNHLCQVTVGKELHEMQGEDKMVNIYDPEQKKELPKSVPVLVELLGQEVSLAIVRSKENQTEKVGDAYVPKADGSTRDVNNIDKVFHTASKMTIHEAQAKQKDANVQPEFWDKWVERNKGQTRDKTQKTNGAGQAGRPGGGAPTSGGNTTGQAPRTSLFGGS